MQLIPITVAAALLAASCACAQTTQIQARPAATPEAQAVDQSIRLAQPVQSGEDPIKAVAARWQSRSVTFVASTANMDHLDQNTSWRGRMYGVIRNTGVLVFRVDNGCLVSGIISPFSTQRQWTIDARLSGCSDRRFNTRMSGSLHLVDSQLQIQLLYRPMRPSETHMPALRVEGTFSTY